MYGLFSYLQANAAVLYVDKTLFNIRMNFV